MSLSKHLPAVGRGFGAVMNGVTDDVSVNLTTVKVP